ncbi:MAG: ATP-binding cassette domain-containing protein [Thermoanaerobaculia bacterium]
MLDLTLDRILSPRLGPDPLSLSFPRSEHVALVGPPASGKTTLLAILHGSVRVYGGSVSVGGRDVTGTRASRRPLFHSLLTDPPSARWSVRRLLIRAARTRVGLSLPERIAAIEEVSESWRIANLLDRRCRDLSSHELLATRLAQIELFRPAVLLAERMFERASAGSADELEEKFWSLMRAAGCTVIHELSHPDEIAWADRVVLLERGKVVIEAQPREAYSAAPFALASLLAPTSSFPVIVRNGQIESPIGFWKISSPPFEGKGFALVHPADFELVGAGEESDFFVNVAEARFFSGRWEVRGTLSGGTVLRVWLPPDQQIRRGKLLPLRLDPERMRLFPVEPEDESA